MTPTLSPGSAPTRPWWRPTTCLYSAARSLTPVNPSGTAERCLWNSRGWSPAGPVPLATRSSMPGEWTLRNCTSQRELDSGWILYFRWYSLLIDILLLGCCTTFSFTFWFTWSWPKQWYPHPPPLFHPIGWTSWPINEVHISNLNWWQIFPWQYIQVFYIHY